jgi:hypothetical protein
MLHGITFVCNPLGYPSERNARCNVLRNALRNALRNEVIEV